MPRTSPIGGPAAGLNAHPTFSGPEAALQTFKNGALLVAAAGFIQEAGANPTAVVGVSAEPGKNLTVAGVAQGVLDGQSRFIPVLPHSVFEMNLDKASALGYLSLQTDLGALYGVTKDANGIWYIDVDKTAGNARVVVVGFRDPVGTASARVYALFKNGNTAYA